MTSRLEVKLQNLKATDDAAGTFEGLASVYGTVDSYGDVVMPGAFTETIRKNGGRIVILNQHDPRDPIGTAELVDTTEGLRVSGKLVMDLPSARDAYTRIKNGLVTGLSIGYITLKERWEQGVRQLLEVDLWEVSLVTFPANPDARISAVKTQAGQLAADIKAGRVLSAANRSRVVAAKDACLKAAASLDELLRLADADTGGGDTKPEDGDKATPQPDTKADPAPEPRATDDPADDDDLGLSEDECRELIAMIRAARGVESDD